MRWIVLLLVLLPGKALGNIINIFTSTGEVSVKTDVVVESTWAWNELDSFITKTQPNQTVGGGVSARWDLIYIEPYDIVPALRGNFFLEAGNFAVWSIGDAIAPGVASICIGTANSSGDFVVDQTIVGIDLFDDSGEGWSYHVGGSGAAPQTVWVPEAGALNLLLIGLTVCGIIPKLCSAYKRR